MKFYETYAKKCFKACFIQLKILPLKRSQKASCVIIVLFLLISCLKNWFQHFAKMATEYQAGKKKKKENETTSPEHLKSQNSNNNKTQIHLLLPAEKIISRAMNPET